MGSRSLSSAVALAALAVVTSVASGARAQTQSESYTASAPTQPSTRWGEAGAEHVSRFGQLIVPSPDLGKSGLIQGGGIGLHFMMPVGWGAYYRYTDAATKNQDGADWFQWELVAGMSRRLMRVGRPELWAFRASARWDFGIGWTQIGTYPSCTRSLVAFGTSCVEQSVRPTEVRGDAMVLETRLAGDVGFGPLSIGADIGISANAKITSSDLAPPAFFFVPSGQLRLGFVLPFT